MVVAMQVSSATMLDESPEDPETSFYEGT
jgi:hypothetical protein